MGKIERPVYAMEHGKPPDARPTRLPLVLKLFLNSIKNRVRTLFSRPSPAVEPSVLAKYASYFHDGSIIAIENFGAEIRIAMESSEIWPEDLTDNVMLTERSTIKGILTMSGVRELEVDGKKSKERLEMRADYATILDFDLGGSKVHFFVEWINYPKSDPGEDYADIVIETDTISWQDDPGLFDPYSLTTIEERFVIPLIVIALPQMKEELADPLLSIYSALGALVHYVVDSYKLGSLSEFPRIFNLIERLHKDGDEYVREAATIGFLEALQNIAGQPDSGINAQVFDPFLGPESKRAWDALNDFWSGK